MWSGELEVFVYGYESGTKGGPAGGLDMAGLPGPTTLMQSKPGWPGAGLKGPAWSRSIVGVQRLVTSTFALKIWIASACPIG